MTEERKQFSFSGLLRRAREEHHFSQNALAKSIGMNTSHLNRIESEDRNPPKRETVIRLADSLGLNPIQTDQLLDSAGYSIEHGKIIKGKLTYRL